MLSILAKRDLNWVKGNGRISLTGVRVTGSGHGARPTLRSSPSAYGTGPHVMAFLKSVSPPRKAIKLVFGGMFCLSSLRFVVPDIV